MVVVGFVSIALVFGASTATMPLLYGAVIDEFGWSRTQASLLFTYKNIASAAVALVLIGPMLVRLGLRVLTLAAFAVTGVGMISFLAVDSLSSYYAAGSMLGLGVATTMICTNVLVSRWFVRNQGLAIGVALAGTSAGGIVFPLLGDSLINAVGWRAAFASLSVFIWLVAIPFYLWKAREEPTAADLLPETQGGHAQQAPIPHPSPVQAVHENLQEILLSAMFWKIAVVLLIVAAADAAVFQHTALLLERDAGLGRDVAAASLSVMFGLGVVAKVAAGKVYDRWSIKGISLWYLLLAASIALALPVAGVLTLILFTTARGIAHGGLIPETAVLAQHCYGPRLMNITLPILTGIWAIGASAGPVTLAMFYDSAGHYRYGLILFVALCLLAAALVRQVEPSYRFQSGLRTARTS